MSTYLDPWHSLVADLEDGLCAPEMGPCPDCGEPVELPPGWSAGYGPVCTPCFLAAERERAAEERS